LPTILSRSSNRGRRQSSLILCRRFRPMPAFATRCQNQTRARRACLTFGVT